LLQTLALREALFLWAFAVAGQTLCTGGGVRVSVHVCLCERRAMVLLLIIAAPLW
jgi:hypothetical protein